MATIEQRSLLMATYGPLVLLAVMLAFCFLGIRLAKQEQKTGRQSIIAPWLAPQFALVFLVLLVAHGWYVEGSFLRAFAGWHRPLEAAALFVLVWTGAAAAWIVDRKRRSAVLGRTRQRLTSWQKAAIAGPMLVIAAAILARWA